MSFSQFGSQVYSFGLGDDTASIATAVGVKAQSLSISRSPEFTAEAKNEDGNVASYVVADDMLDFTLSGFLIDAALFTTGKSFTYDGHFFIVTGRKSDETNTDFTKCEITGKSYALITS